MALRPFTVISSPRCQSALAFMRPQCADEPHLTEYQTRQKPVGCLSSPFPAAAWCCLRRSAAGPNRAHGKPDSKHPLKASARPPHSIRCDPQGPAILAIQQGHSNSGIAEASGHRLSAAGQSGGVWRHAQPVLCLLHRRHASNQPNPIRAARISLYRGGIGKTRKFSATEG